MRTKVRGLRAIEREVLQERQQAATAPPSPPAPTTSRPSHSPATLSCRGEAEPASSVEAAVADCLAEYGPDARIAVILKGPYVLPCVG